MFLSNLNRYFLLLILIAPISQACSGTPSNTNTDKPNIGELKSEFPFSTKEPESYQGDFFVTIGSAEEHFFRARKGERSRIDFFKNGLISVTQIVADKTYTIDPTRKVFTEDALAAEALNAVPVFDSTNGFFAGKEFTAFEEIGREGSMTRYRVKSADPAKGEIIVSVDTISGLMIRQEFLAPNGENSEKAANVIFEIRNLSLDVDDSVFQLPAGMRKVTKEEFRNPKPKAAK